jgi:hypothetical protein
MSYPLADTRRMQGRLARWAGRVGVAALLSGCGAETAPAPTDTATDVQPDATVDTSEDATPDTAPDSATVDAASDGAQDGADDGRDTGEPGDAPHDAGDDAGDDAGGDAGDDTGDGGPETPSWLPALSSLDDHDALRVPPGDIKYLAWVDGAERVAPLVDACAFQDMHRFDYHLFFLRSLAPWADLTPQGYARLVLFRDTRSFWGGGVRFDAARVHPTTGVPGALVWTVATDEGPGQVLTLADLLAADAAIAPCLPAFDEVRAFAPSSDAQRALVTREAAAIVEAGIAVVAAP